MVKNRPAYGMESSLVDRLCEPEWCVAFLRSHGFEQAVLGDDAKPAGVSLTRSEGMFRATLVVGNRTPPRLLFEVREHPSSRQWKIESSYLHKRPSTLGQLAYHAWTIMEAVAIP